jgi:hypothetical protein
MAVTLATNSTIERLAGPSFHDGSGSRAKAVPDSSVAPTNATLDPLTREEMSEPMTNTARQLRAG